jgi:3-oxoadipate enol-lactonase
MPLAYTELGSGSPLVLLHAFPLDRGMWEPQRPIAEKHRLITVDLPGFGETAVDPNFGMNSAADQVAELLDSLNINKAAIGGLSMGGYVALAFARRHADRLTHLILADTRREADDAPGRENRDRLIKLTTEFGPSKVYEVMLPKVLGESTKANHPKVVEFARGIAARQSGSGVIGGLTALRDRPDSTPGLAEIEVPTLIIVGEEDVVTPPPLSEAMAKAITGSTLVRIPEAGHLSNMEKPEAFNTAVLDFLQ